MSDYYKDYKGCANCKHQPMPLMTCEWLKTKKEVMVQCPRWEKK